MVFNSVEFAVFLPLVFILYWTVLRKRQNALLLVGSYIFYGWWDWRFLGLILISTVTDFFVAQAIENSDDDGRRRLFMYTSVAVNLGILGFFKYFNFFIDSAADTLNLPLGLNTTVSPIWFRLALHRPLSCIFGLWYICAT